MEEATNSTTKHSKAKAVKHLVLDTGAIIANVNLHEIADFYYSPPDVIAELRSQKAMKTYETLSFEIILEEPSAQAMQAVFDASKKTGDYQSLSITDMKVIALTYDLHKELVDAKSRDSENKSQDVQHGDANMTFILTQRMNSLSTTDYDSNSSVSPEHEDMNVGNDDSTKTTPSSKLPEGFCENEVSDDEDGWITEDNLKSFLKKMGTFEVEEGLIVGCLTTDFALQNVLLHMDLGLVSIAGYRIKKLKSFILRCRACYNTTSNMSKQFCPSCGNKMLHKCAVSVNEDGEQILHINWRRLENKRGLKHSIAAPKGGKHAVNERLFEDQRIPQNRMAKLNNDPLTDNPFSIHDITSRSAVLGIRTMNNRQNRRRNPNEGRGNRRK